MYLNKYFAKPKLNKIEIALIIFILIFGGLLSINNWPVKASSGLVASNTIDGLLISQDNSKGDPSKNIVTVDPSINYSAEANKLAKSTSEVETVPFQNLINKKWFVQNPFDSESTYKIAYKLSPDSLLEIRYNQSKQELYFVLPKFNLYLNNHDFFIDETIVATVNNLAQDKVVYLGDYKGFPLKNYQSGQNITFKELLNNKIYIYSTLDKIELVKSDTTCTVKPLDNLNKELSNICFKENYENNLDLNQVYLVSFNLANNNPNYVKYSFKLAENEKELDVINSPLPQKTEKTILVQNTVSQFDQLFTVKNAKMNFLQFSLSSIAEWQDLNIQIKSLSIQKLKFENIAEIKPNYDLNLILDRKSLITIPEGKTEITTNKESNKDFTVSSQNSTTTVCNLQNLNPSEGYLLNYNLLNFIEDVAPNISNNAQCQSISLFYPISSNFNYNLSLKYELDNQDILKIKSNFADSNTVYSSNKSNNGINLFETKIDPSDSRVAGLILELSHDKSSKLKILSTSITKDLPKDLNNFILQKTSANKQLKLNISSSPSLLKNTFSTETNDNNLFITSNYQLPFFSYLKPENKDYKIIQYSNNYLNPVWYIECNHSCGKINLVLNNSLLTIAKLAFALTILIVFIYILAKSFWSSCKNIILKKMNSLWQKITTYLVSKANYIWNSTFKLERYLVQNKVILAFAVMLFLPILYLTIGIRIAFVFLISAIVLRFNIKALTIVLTGITGIILMYILKFTAIIPFILKNRLLTKAINQSNAEFIGNYSYYIILVGIIIYLKEVLKANKIS